MKKFLAIGGGIVLAAALIYGVMVIQSKAIINDQLSVLGYPGADVKSAHVFFDGIVVNDIALTPDKTIKRVYIKANPFQMIIKAPQFLAVEDVDLTVNDLLNNKIGFIDTIAFTTDDVRLSLLRSLPLDVKIKQNSPTSALIYFKGKNDFMRVKGQGEIYFQDHMIHTINIDISRLDMSFNKLKTKRADGWLSFSFKDTWILAGELGAGYADVNSLELSDATVTLSGTVDRPVWNMSGKDRKTEENIAVEYSDQSIRTFIKNDQFQYAEENPFGLNTFIDIKKNADNTLRPIPVVVVTKAWSKPNPVKKAKVIKPVHGAPSVFEIVDMDKKPFDRLIHGSFFEGINYTNDLIVIDVPCPVQTMQNCWSARARGGIISLDPNVPPAYFSRMKDYAAAQALRQVLQNLDIKTIALLGVGSTVQRVAIQGKTNNDQSVDVELSVSDVD